MRLSEAMRLGAMNRPQAFHQLFDPVTGGTCANGAAAEAIGLLEVINGEVFRVMRAPDEWRWCRSDDTSCPACTRPDSTTNTVIHLNNDHRWTRERIADWVEEQEALVGLTREAEGITEVAAAWSSSSGDVNGQSALSLSNAVTSEVIG